MRLEYTTPYNPICRVIITQRTKFSKYNLFLRAANGKTYDRGKFEEGDLLLLLEEEHFNYLLNALKRDLHKWKNKDW